MNIEAGKHFKTRDGRKAYVAAIRPHPSNYPLVGWIEDGIEASCWTPSGPCHLGGEHRDDLTSEWHEPLTVEAWCNVYVDGGRSWYKSKDEADTASGWVKSTTRIACIYMSGKEGVGP